MNSFIFVNWLGTNKVYKAPQASIQLSTLIDCWFCPLTKINAQRESKILSVHLISESSQPKLIPVYTEQTPDVLSCM